MKEALRVVKINDEYYTPTFAVEIIEKYLKPNSKILCPFDKKYSNFVKVLTDKGHIVSYSHIDNFDFFDLTKEDVKEYDYIVSNPPYSIKTKVIKKMYELNRPFAMLLPITTLEGIERGKLFNENGIELIVLNKRINFMGGSNKTNNWFNTSYFCKGILKEDKLIFEALK